MKREDFKEITKEHIEFAKVVCNDGSCTGYSCLRCPLSQCNSSNGFTCAHNYQSRAEALKEFIELFGEKDSTGIKYDAKKLRWDLLPLHILLDMKSYLSIIRYTNKDALTFVKECNWLMLGAKLINDCGVTDEEIVEIYTKGAEKYGDNNWKRLENGEGRYIAALLRHLMAKDEINPDFGIRHVAHAVWNCIAAQWFRLNK